jgi:hypothetical protein
MSLVVILYCSQWDVRQSEDEKQNDADEEHGADNSKEPDIVLIDAEFLQPLSQFHGTPSNV